MADSAQVEILRQGRDIWNDWQSWIGPAVVFIGVLSMLISTNGPAVLAMLVVLSLRACLWLYLGLAGRGVAQSLASSRALRSQYEAKMREAGAQEERHRLARDLHDSIKQQTFAIHTSAATAQVRLEGDGNGARRAIDQIRIAARDAMTEMEVMLDQLRAEPLEAAGLLEALKRLCETTGFRIGAPVACIIDTPAPFAPLAPDTAQTVLRVAQEALANVARHARASHVTVTLHSAGGHMTLTVEDDGVGLDRISPDFSPMSRGMGLANMRSRAEELGGDLRITDRAGGTGTTVTLSIPPHRTPAPASTVGWWLAPVGLFACLSVAKQMVDRNLHPELYTAIRWAGAACLLSLMPLILIWAGRQHRRNKMAAAQQGQPS